MSGASFIYVIAESPEGPTKIGFSKDPARRVRQLQTGHARPLSVFHTEEIDDTMVRLMETAIHSVNRHRRLSGEWYDLTVDDAIAEVRLGMICHEEEIEAKARVRALRENQKTG